MQSHYMLSRLCGSNGRQLRGPGIIYLVGIWQMGLGGGVAMETDETLTGLLAWHTLAK